MITLEEYFGRMLHIEGPSTDVRANAAELLERVNALLADCSAIPAAADPVVNSGWRPAGYNASIPNAAPKSKHITGQAIDIGDPEGDLDDFLFNSPHVLAARGLYMEHPLATKGWCHLQSVAPRSGNRIFFP